MVAYPAITPCFACQRPNPYPGLDSLAMNATRSSDGRALENLVRTVEEFFLPKGCKVEVRKLVYGDEGAQLAELDILVTGRLGTTDIRWLIECRDRPSDGRAPVAWVEQLYGRKQAHGFNQVTAVSTTGFSDGAAEVADRLGIELRTVSDAKIEDFGSWLYSGAQFSLHNQIAALDHATVFPVAGEVPERLEALKAKLAAAKSDEKLLRVATTGKLLTMPEAFAGAVSQSKLFEGMSPEEEKRVRIRAEYPGDEHFVIDTAAGAVRVAWIGFEGRLLVKVTQMPVESLKQYSRDVSGAVISQSAVLADAQAGSLSFAIELHNLAETGETHVVLRKR